MESKNHYLEQVIEETRQTIISFISKEKEKYKNWLKELLLQGLIKMMDSEVVVRCKKSDYELVKSIIEPATEEFIKKVKEEVPKLKTKGFKCKVSIDDLYLPEINSKESGLDSCIGGIYIMSKNKKIICKNTIDERLILAYQETLPQIRKDLFAS